MNQREHFGAADDYVIQYNLGKQFCTRKIFEDLMIRQFHFEVYNPELCNMTAGDK